MAASYPNAIKTFTDPTAASNLNFPSHAQQHIDENDEIEAVETELGISPKGTYASVRARLDATPSLATIVGVIYPVGSIYTSTVSTNPATVFGIGTWTAFGAGRVPVGIATTGTFAVAAETLGGVETVTLTAAQSGVPAHTHPTTVYKAGYSNSHDFAYFSAAARTTEGTFTVDTGSNSAATASTAHTNLQPYITVYMWKRTA